ncbi:chorion class B protein M3A5-like [Zerene cesonia]|uniref:chorion class B protein M3A5-like n=1 Tax=Zerene cesonia TaxID=33412 RepID=UPI0018E50695|nr:chorion class B protein M3A5-like [Zerene cesonia]
MYAADRFAADIYATERYTAERLAAPFAPLAFEYPLGYAGAAASYGGGLAVASSSPLPPSGVSILSENAFEGPLAVAGQLPFLGTAALEGALPTIGSGAVNYGCGNGNVGILSEGPAALSGYGPAYGAASAYGAAYGPAYGPAYGAYGSAYSPCGRC